MGLDIQLDIGPLNDVMFSLPDPEGPNNGCKRKFSKFWLGWSGSQRTQVTRSLPNCVQCLIPVASYDGHIDDDEIKSITGNREVVVLDDDFEDVGGALMPRNLELEDAEETQTFSQTSQSQPQSCQSWSWPQTQTDSFGDGADGAGVLSRASTGRSSKGRGRGRTARQQTSQSLQLQGLLAKPVHELAKMYIGERKKTERLESTKKQQLKEVLSLRRKCKRLEKDNKQLSQTLAVNI